VTEPAQSVHELVSALDYPMFIVTANDGHEMSGCLIGFATQCSIKPPRFLICVSDKNHTHGVVQRADSVVVHLVPAEADELAELFGSQTGDEIDKFARCVWHEGPAGAPVLDECENWFAGRILQRVDAGDHCALLLDPFEAHAGPDERPFTFHRARRIEPGHEA
jgi:flavin reductase (DIM6/NTAB) family NADH-FMN oxidoreductase RutF